MNNETNNDSFQEIDLRELLTVLMKWKWLITIITIVSVITSGILSFFVLPPVYETKTVLMAAHATDAKRTVQGSDDLEGVVSTLARLPEMTINTYVGQLKNDALLETVIKRLKLAEDGYNTKSLSNMISTNVVKDTNLIEVKVTNTDPVLAALIANTLSEEFLKFISEKNRERMSQSVEVLKEQIVSIDKALGEANKALSEFNSQPRSISFVEQELRTKLGDLTTYQSMLIQAIIELEQFNAGKKQLEITLENTKPVLVKETKETQGVNAETNEPIVVTKTIEEPNPAYINVLAQLDSQKLKVAEHQAKVNSVSNVISTLENEAKKLQAELTEKKVTFTSLNREVERLERNHELFGERLVQTQIFQSIDIGETSILVVAPAMEPTSPIKPKKVLNMAIALVLALMVGIFLAFILEFFDNNIKTAEDVRKHLDLPVMGSIPKITNNKTEGM